MSSHRASWTSRDSFGALLAVLLGGTGASARAQCSVTELDRLDPSSLVGLDVYAASLSADGDVAVAGAPSDTVQQGRAFVYRFDGSLWAEEQVLSAPSPEIVTRFGAAVAVSGDVILSGAPYQGAFDEGQVHVYRFDPVGGAWSEEQVLTGPLGQNLGAAVAVSGNVAVASADTLSLFPGMARVYRYNGSQWVLEKTLTGATSFARALDVEGNVLVGGAPQGLDAHQVATGSAAVYRYNGSTWNLETLVTPSDGVAQDAFGSAVSLDGTRLVVGAPGAGAAYAFEFDGSQWNEVQKVTSSDGVAGDRFGASVALAGDALVVGASQHAGGGTAYLFRRTGNAWVEKRRLLPGDGMAGDEYGSVAVLSRPFALVGAPRHDPSGLPDAGAAYVHSTESSLTLEITPVAVQASDTVVFDSYFSSPGNLGLLAVVESNGVSGFIPLFFGHFGADFRWRLALQVPPGLSGVLPTFQILGFDLCGKLVLGNRVPIFIQ